MEGSAEHDQGVRCSSQLSITMDFDSGYMSRNAESNQDSCMDFNKNEGTLTRKAIYLSEDALLEKPEVAVRKLEDLSEVISASESSEEPNYSAMFDSEPGPSSDDSSIIPVARPIVAFNSALSNITNTLETNGSQKRLTLIFSKLDKENAYSVKRKHWSFSSEEESGTTGMDLDSSSTMDMSGTFCDSEASFLENETALPNDAATSATPEKRIVNTVDPELSPDLFAEEDQEVRRSPVPVVRERYVTRCDQLLLNKVCNSLKGVLPPHSVTVVELSIEEMLEKIHGNEDLFWDRRPPNGTKGEPRTLLLSGREEDIRNKGFPDILKGRWHGLHHNRSKLSEQIEESCIRYGERYVGAETQSSCTSVSTKDSSPPKQRALKRFGLKSPGRRLSHLAKRRITFSSANLQASSSFAGSRARQILVDARKLDMLKRKSPRKTPSKSPRIKTRTPSSSAKKKLAVRFRKLTGEIEKTVVVSTSKRKLFGSPVRENKSGLFLPSTAGNPNFDEDTRRPTKRALFMSPKKNSPNKYSPFKKSPHKRLLDVQRKRKRSEFDDNPPLLKPHTITSHDVNELKLGTKGKSEGSEMSATHKKKLQWAVYEALSSQNVRPTHPHFKLFASILARATKRLLPHYGAVLGRDVGTSEKMARITRCHVFAVTKGKSVDEIVGEYLRNRTRNVKPQGYVGVDESMGGKKEEGEGEFRRRDTDRIRKVINFGDER